MSSASELVYFGAIYLVLWAALAAGLSAPASLVIAGAATLAATALPLEVLPKIWASVAHGHIASWSFVTVGFVLVFARLALALGIDEAQGPRLVRSALLLTGGSAAALARDAQPNDDPASPRGMTSELAGGLATLAPFGVPLVLGAVLFQTSVAQVATSALIPAAIGAMAAAFLMPEQRSPVPRNLRAIFLRPGILPAFVAVAAFWTVVAGLFTPAEAFALGVSGLLVLVLRRDGLSSALEAISPAILDVGRLALLIVMTVMLDIAALQSLEPLGSLEPVGLLALALGISLAFGAVGGPVIAVVVLAPTASVVVAHGGVGVVELIVAAALAGEAGRFIRGQWTSPAGLAAMTPRAFAWAVALLIGAVLCLSTDAWVLHPLLG